MKHNLKELPRGRHNNARPIGFSVTIKRKPTVPLCMSPQLQVDFRTGTEENLDIAYCFQVYFGECVVMNSWCVGAKHVR